MKIFQLNIAILLEIHFSGQIRMSIVDLPEPAEISMIDGLDGPLNGAIVLSEVGVVCEVGRQ